MKKYPLFTISILVIDQFEATRACIDSLIKNAANFQLILTDNGSTDEKTREYLDYLAAEIPNVGLIVNKTNQGFGRGHNKALEFALGQYFVTINNDMVFYDDPLEPMREAFRDPGVGLVGLKGTCSQLDKNGVGMAGELEYVEASCMMIPRYLALKVGLFNPQYRKAYCEDVDLSLRIRKLGYRLAQVSVPCDHKRASTANALPPAEDIPGCHAFNHQVLLGNWERYFKRRNFKERILIKRETAHGDALLITPIIRALKAENAEREIFVETYHPDVFEGNRDIKAALNSYTHTDFDRVIDLNLAYERRPNLHIVDAYADAAGIAVENKLPVFNVQRSARIWASKFMIGNPWTVFHCGPTNWPGRDIEESKFREVSSWLRVKGFKTAVIGRPSSSLPIEADFDARGITDSPQKLAAVIERSSLFVGIDSFPMHLAQALKIPIVAVFGIVDPRLRLADVPFFKPVQAQEVSCLGCHHVGPAPKTAGKCLRDRPICMERITVAQIKQAIKEAMEAYTMQLETSKIREEVLPYLGEEGRGIDIGCGRDKITSYAIGFDDDPSPEVDIRGDASARLPFEDGHFDWLYSSHCLEDILDTERTLKEWTRIVKTGGVVALYVPHPELYKGVNLEHKHQGFTPEELSGYLEALGFEILLARADEGDNRYSSLVIGRKK